MVTKVLVTGANGQLARTLKSMFSINKDNVQFVFVTKKELDITKKKEVKLFLNKGKFDYCINCAAYTNVDQAENKTIEAFKVNAEGVKNLALSCHANKTILIHISTDYVFDGKKSTPYSEDDLTNPINEYGKSKLLGEEFVQDIMDKYFIIRSSWLYSAYGKNFLKTIVGKIKQEVNLNIVSNQKGTPTSCEYLSTFIYHLITKKIYAFGLYHFSPEGETSWFNFAMEISKYFPDYDQSKITSTDNYKTLAKRPKYSVLNNTRRENIYSYTPKWEECLELTVRKIMA